FPAVWLGRIERPSARHLHSRRAYGRDFFIFRAWCEERQLEVLPASPATVAAFLAREASRNVKASTICRRTAAIRYAHKLARLDTPTDDEMVKATEKAPATAERLLAMSAWPCTPQVRAACPP